MSKKQPSETVSLNELHKQYKAEHPAPESIEKNVLAHLKAKDAKKNKRYQRIAEGAVGLIIFLIVLPHGLQTNKPEVEPMNVTEMLARVQNAKPGVSKQPATAPVAKKETAPLSLSLTMDTPALMADPDLSLEENTQPEISDISTSDSADIISAKSIDVISAESIDVVTANNADVMSAESATVISEERATSALSEQPERLSLYIVNGKTGQFLNCQQEPLHLPITTEQTGWITAWKNTNQEWQWEAAEQPENCQPEEAE